MALFDALLAEVNARFQVENKAQELLSTLLTMITDEKRGGLRGFLDLFHRVGLGDVADTWVSEGANTPLSDQQAEDAFGENTIREIANRVKLPAAATTSALAFMTPAIVDAVTPDGIIPNHRALLATLGSYLGTSAANVGSSAAQNQSPALAATADGGGNSFLRTLLPLLLFALLAYLAYLFLAQPNQQVARLAVNTNRTATVNANAATTANSNTLAIVTNSSNSTGIIGTGEEAIRAANERARLALSALSLTAAPQQVIDALNLSIVNFAKDSAEIPEENRALLRRAADILKTAPATTRIEIGGHTDNDGDDAYNQQLSERRAIAVKDELVKLGVNSNILTAKGYGETQPRATNDTAEGRFQNRRIEYTLTIVNNATTTTTTTVTTAPANSHSSGH